ncbi:pilus assembly PilX family protein [Oceanospirillum sp.]|uniref:pilus assembly PilX family protein n=1 Tax=Oceanospirillum sp. TaxID=2021254 RepID=UPI003A934534
MIAISLKRHQAGLATLMFTVVLLVSLTIMAFLSARTLLMEQAVSANENRSREIEYAAEAALEYGIAWLNRYAPDFATWNDLTAPDSVITAGSDRYNLSVDYLPGCVDPGLGAVKSACVRWLVEVRARAAAESDSDLTRQQVVRLVEDRISHSPAILYIRIPGSWRDW